MAVRGAGPAGDAGSRLRISVLGSLSCELDSEPLDLGPRRQRAVLARLVAGRGRVVSTDRLIDDLWNGEPPPKALAGLQVQVSNLRRVIEPSRPPRAPATVLVSEQPGYALRLPDAAVDAWEFEATVTGAASDSPERRLDELDAALRLWRGDPYGGFAGDSWAQPEVARLHDLRRSAIEQWAALAVDHGRAAQVAQVLAAECDDQPAREEFFRVFALALYRLGRQADALAALRRLRSYLADELGVDPAPAIQQLEGDILQQSSSLDTPAAPRTPAPAVRSPGPSTAAPAERREPAGREDELVVLSGHADTAAADGLRVVWVSAEAGGGKSTLAQTLVGRLESGGWVGATGHCPEVDGAPTAWAWREMLQQLAVQRDSNTSEGLDTTFDIARRMVDACAARSTAPGTILVLDDAHRADGATLQVLRQLVTWMARSPILVLVTYRASEAGVDLLATTASLAAVTADHVDLKGLSDNGIRELARSVGLGDVDATLLDLLRSRTDGNPLFTRELAKLIASRGPSEAVDAIPDGVKDVLLQRIQRLPAEVATVLRLVALFGRTAPIDGVLALWSRSGGGAAAEDEVLDAVDTAVAAGLLTADIDSVHFNHVLVRDTVYDSVPALRKRRLHWQIVKFLERVPDADPDELAHHAALGVAPDTLDHAIELVTRAARARFRTEFKADSAESWRSAVLLHESAGHAGADARAADRRALVDALTHLVTALAFRGDDTIEARERRRQALDLARGLGDDDLVMSALTCWRAPVIWTIRRQRVADTELIAAMTDALPRATDVQRVYLLVSAVFELEGIDDRRAIGLAEQAVQAATQHDDPEALCAAWNARVYTALGPDASAGLPDFTDEFARVARESGILAYQAAAHFFSFLARAAQTDLPGAASEVQQGLRSASAGRAGELVVVLSAFSAVLEALGGDIDRAEGEYRDLTARLEAAGAVNAAEIGLVGEMVIGWFRGSLAHLVEPLGVVVGAAPQMVSWPYVVALLDAGRPDEARRVAETAPPVSRDFYWTAMSVFHARALVRLQMVEAAAELYDELRRWSGTVAGLNSGSVVFDPMDVVLAELAELLGDHAAAADHRRSEAKVRAEVESGLTALGRR
ncbi:UNVERIFIED_ORG: DNA-binding SARP family transcriptional activator [Gordonia westfalica J30]